MKTKLKFLVLKLVLPFYLCYMFIKHKSPVWKYGIDGLVVAWKVNHSRLEHKFGLSKIYTYEELMIELNK